MKFWDTSALVTLLVQDPRSAFALSMLEDDGNVLAWWGTPVECTSAVARLEREGRLPEAQVNEILLRLRELARYWYEVQPGNVLRSQAQRMLRVHALRAADSLQLAAAYSASEGDPTSLEFVCFDAVLNRAASREGFQVRAG